LQTKDTTDLLKTDDSINSTIYIKRPISSNTSLFIFTILSAAAANAGSLFAFSSVLQSGVTNEDALLGSLTGFVVALLFSIFKIVNDKSGGETLLTAIFTCSAAAVIAVFVFLFRSDIAGAILNITNVYIKTLGLTFAYSNAPSLQNVEYTVPVIIYAAAITLAVCYAIVVKKSIGAVIFLTFPIVVILIISGMFPAPAAICAMVAAILAISDYKKTDRVYSAFFAAIVAVICMVAANAVANKTAPYFEKNNITNIITIYERISTDIREAGKPQNSYTVGAIKHGDLSEIDNIKFTGDPLLEVSFPKSKNTLYLRGFIASDYYNNRWYELAGKPKQGEIAIAAALSDKTVSPLLMDGANTLGTPSIPFSVRDLTQNSEYLYLPYTLTVESGEKFLSADKTSFEFSENSYSGEYFGAFDYEFYKRIFEFNKPLSDSEKSADELLYRDFVYENYLNIPDVFRGAEIVLDKEFYAFVGEEEGIDYDNADEMRIMSRKLYYIKNWLRENCEYDLSVGKVPEGEDFVNRFLEETRAGSCSHFSSAAVLLCRSAGIPARYIEGYVVKPRDFPDTAENGEEVTVKISDTRAHAWVEVYIDEYGWYPYEFTSGYGNVRTSITLETPQITTATTVTTAATAITTETAETEVTTAPQSANSANSTQSTQSTQLNGAANTAASTTSNKTTSESEEIIAQTQKTPNPFLLLLLIPAILAVSAAIIPIRRTIILRRREANLKKLTPEAAINRAFGEIVPIMKEAGIDTGDIYRDFAGACEKLRESIFSEAEEIAVLAVNTAFAGYKPNSLDKQTALSALAKIKTTYYNSFSKRRQFYEKYFRVFL
jgi:hypothetical protein